MAVMVAGDVGRWASSPRDVWLVLWVMVADVVATLAVAAGIGEITIVNLPGVLFTETVPGPQVEAVEIGLLGGYGLRSRPPGTLVSRR